ncbi:hypothetical protein HF086_005937 [Spodoptera exigua]|uniref:Uncharacterized protein n=1 Tax=Spodoptera exigua TaxID=7107 RepID=A0A922MVL6_SPOEX|nr:hypothetical protein HF086_005937 [Spodoptera exigua]
MTLQAAARWRRSRVPAWDTSSAASTRTGCPHTWTRTVLREKLKCKSFQWYLDNIYKEKFVPVRDVYGYGRFKNEASRLCLDTLQREGEAAPLGCYPCHPDLQATQYFSFSLAGELRDEFNCAVVQTDRRCQVRCRAREATKQAARAEGKHRKRHGRKRRGKKRTKNKFILKIMRTLMNGTEEHLEMDIHCKHRQLYPNNTFVRDLVTILNDKNVKVTEVQQQAQKVLNKLDIEPSPPSPSSSPLRHQPGSHGGNLAQMREGQQVKLRLKKNKSHPAVQSVITREPANAALSHGGGPRGTHGGHREGDNKIIIEDFVEVKRLTVSPPPKEGMEGQSQHTHKRKRKKNRGASRSRPTASTTPGATSTPPPPPPTAMVLPEPDSLRERLADSRSEEHSSSDKADNSAETPLLSDSMDRSDGREDWPVGESRYRSKPQRRSNVDSQSAERPAPSQPRLEPRLEPHLEPRLEPHLEPRPPHPHTHQEPDIQYTRDDVSQLTIIIYY